DGRFRLAWWTPAGPEVDPNALSAELRQLDRPTLQIGERRRRPDDFGAAPQAHGRAAQHERQRERTRESEAPWPSRSTGRTGETDPRRHDDHERQPDDQREDPSNSEGQRIGRLSGGRRGLKLG